MKAFPRLKYCGITRKVDLIAAVACGADAIGLNFVSSSPRCVPTSVARELLEDLASQVLSVGVFVNESVTRVAEIVTECGIQAIQLHGDEPLAWMLEAAEHSALRDIPIIRAVTWRGVDSEQEQVRAWVASWHRNFLGFLVDAYSPLQRGGSGNTVCWDLLHPRPSVFSDYPILLAGGIKPENVSEAIRLAKPDGIDVASGIESAPGIKDAEKMRAMADAVIAALD